MNKTCLSPVQKNVTNLWEKFMNEEVKSESKEKECFCKSELVQRTIAVTIGSFIGVYLALSLFCAMHRPPMMIHHHKHFLPQQHRIMQNGFPDKIKPNRMNKEDFQKYTEERVED